MKKLEANLPEVWEAWCKTGNYSVGNKRKAVMRCLNRETSEVRGFYSDLLLSPTINHTHSLYPSFEHTTHPKCDHEGVVEARIFNDMKSHLNTKEFWHAVEHLFAVGIAKNHITSPSGLRHDDWLPERHYIKKEKMLTKKGVAEERHEPSDCTSGTEQSTQPLPTSHSMLDHATPNTDHPTNDER